MTEVIDYLCASHRKMSVALRALSNEISHFETGKTLDYGIAFTALDYMRRATCLNHHEVEDEMYRKVLSIDKVAGETLQNILIDHEKLAFLANALFEAIANVESDTELPRYWLVSVAREYLNAEWRHIRAEERMLYPAAQKLLSAEDWGELSTMFKKVAALDFIRSENDDLEDLYEDLVDWTDFEPVRHSK